MKRSIFNMSKVSYYAGAIIAFVFAFMASITEDNRIISAVISSIFIAVLWPIFVVIILIFILYMQTLGKSDPISSE